MYTLPTMTEHSLVKDKNIQIKDIFRYFVTTQKSQSTIYSGDIESYDFLMRMYGDDAEALKNNIIDSLTTLYKRYFPTVEVNVNILDTVMYIDVGVLDEDGKEYTLSNNTVTTILSDIDDIVKLYN